MSIPSRRTSSPSTRTECTSETAVSTWQTLENGGIVNLFITCLLRQGIGGLDDIAVVCGTCAHDAGNVGRSCGAWLVLQAFEVGADVFAVDLDFELVGKDDIYAGVGVDGLLDGTERQDPQRIIGPQTRALGLIEYEIPSFSLAVAR